MTISHSDLLFLATLYIRFTSIKASNTATDDVTY